MLEFANLGRKSEAMLRRAGVTTMEQLRGLGAVGTNIKVKRSGAKPSLNLLWALKRGVDRAIMTGRGKKGTDTTVAAT